VLGEEQELPEDIRQFIKSEKEEKLFRELYEKGGAAEHFKTKNQSYKQKLEDLEPQYTGLVEEVKELQELYGSGDIDGFLEKLSIPEEAMLKWAVDKVRYQQMPQEHKQILEAKRSAEREARELAKSNQSSQAQLNQMMVEMKRQEIESTLSKPEIKSYMQEFDKRAGREGSFVRELLDRGDRAWNRKEYLTPDQIVGQIMGLYNFGAAQVTQQASQPMSTQKNEPPVIPNVQGKGSSPLKKGPRSIADLKKLAKEYRD